LERQGIVAERIDLPRGSFSRLGLFSRGAEYDAVLLQKRLFSSWMFQRLRRVARRLIYDFDDPMIYSRQGGVVKLSTTRIGRFRRVVGASDVVVAGNPALAELAREYGATRVETIPTCVDLARWTPRTRPGEGTVVGWAGTASNLCNLLWIAPALEGRTLRVLCSEALAIPGVNVEFVAWEERNEPAQIGAFDIGIAPLPNDLWSRWKMPYKILAYFAAGVPVLASRRGAVESVIRNGVNGLVADSCEEWRECLTRLAGNPELRMRLGHAGRETVEREFGIERAVQKWKSILLDPPDAKPGWSQRR